MRRNVDALFSEGLLGFAITCTLLSSWVASSLSFYQMASLNSRGLPIEPHMMPIAIAASILPALQVLGWIVGGTMALTEWIRTRRNAAS